MKKWPNGWGSHTLVSLCVESHSDSLVGFCASLTSPLSYRKVKTKQKNLTDSKMGTTKTT